MKSIYLPALEMVNFEDIANFLNWLDTQHLGRISLIKLQKTPQVQSVKLGPILRLLEQFAFIRKEQNTVSISPNGLKFTRADHSVRKAMIKNQIVTAWPFQSVLNHLDTSGSDRMTKKELLELLKPGTSMQITAHVISGIIAWGQLCELFQFVETTQEISRIFVERPFPSGDTDIPFRKGA